MRDFVIMGNAWEEEEQDSQPIVIATYPGLMRSRVCMHGVKLRQVQSDGIEMQQMCVTQSCQCCAGRAY